MKKQGVLLALAALLSMVSIGAAVATSNSVIDGNAIGFETKQVHQRSFSFNDNQALVDQLIPYADTSEPITNLYISTGVSSDILIKRLSFNHTTYFDDGMDDPIEPEDPEFPEDPEDPEDPEEFYNFRNAAGSHGTTRTMMPELQELPKLFGEDGNFFESEDPTEEADFYFEFGVNNMQSVDVIFRPVSSEEIQYCDYAVGFYGDDLGLNGVQRNFNDPLISGKEVTYSWDADSDPLGGTVRSFYFAFSSGGILNGFSIKRIDVTWAC